MRLRLLPHENPAAATGHHTPRRHPPLHASAAASRVLAERSAESASWVVSSAVKTTETISGALFPPIPLADVPPHRTQSCPRGHDKDVVGRREDGTCRQCLRERDDRRRRQRSPTPRHPGGAVGAASASIEVRA
jgi:hypothetical protein